MLASSASKSLGLERALQRQFHLKPSYLFTIVLLVGHLVVIVTITLLALPLWASSALIVLLAINLAYVLWLSALLRSPQSCVAFRLNVDGIELESFSGKLQAVRLGSDSVVTSWLTVITLVAESGERRRMLIFPDSLDAESFRQLRLWLKWAGQPTQ